MVHELGRSSVRESTESRDASHAVPVQSSSLRCSSEHLRQLAERVDAVATRELALRLPCLRELPVAGCRDADATRGCDGFGLRLRLLLGRLRAVSTLGGLGLLLGLRLLGLFGVTELGRSLVDCLLGLGLCSLGGVECLVDRRLGVTQLLEGLDELRALVSLCLACSLGGGRPGLVDLIQQCLELAHAQAAEIFGDVDLVEHVFPFLVSVPDDWRLDCVELRLR